MVGKTKTARLLKSMKQTTHKVTPIATEMVLPNLSGIARHPEAMKTFVEVAGDTMTGELIFSSSGAGLAFGCIEGTDESIVCATQNTWYQVTFDTAGSSNNTTLSTVNNDITILKTGKYLIGITACFHSNPSQDWEVAAKKNNGATELLHLFQTTAVADKVENAAGTCMPSLTATDTLELWVRCTSADAQTAVFDHVNINCVQIGG